MRQTPWSASSHESTIDEYSPITDGPFALTGIFGERSCGLRYLRTVGSDTPVALEMPAMDSPSLRILRIFGTGVSRVLSGSRSDERVSRAGGIVAT